MSSSNDLFSLGHQNASIGGHSVLVMLGSTSCHECAHQVRAGELLSLDLYGTNHLLSFVIHSFCSQSIRIRLYVQ